MRTLDHTRVTIASFASDVAMEVTTNAVQVLGGYGYTRDYPSSG